MDSLTDSDEEAPGAIGVVDNQGKILIKGM